MLHVALLKYVEHESLSSFKMAGRLLSIKVFVVECKIGKRTQSSPVAQFTLY